MSKLSERDEVINFMKEIDGRTPILLIGKAAYIFKRIYRGRIYQMNNLDDIEIINNMNIAKLNKVVTLFDVSFMTNTENMLKLVEETSCRLILLASRDNLPETIISRCKNILKIPFAESKELNLIKKKDAYNMLANSEDTLDEKTLFIAENRPSLMLDLEDTKELRYKDRIRSILSNIEE